jgi:hypothetical protein
MLGPSLKSVPGCLVSIVPILIGVPVALTPGLGPHLEVSVDPPELELLDDELEPPPAAAALLLLELLLPQPVTTTSRAITDANASSSLTRGTR